MASHPAFACAVVDDVFVHKPLGELANSGVSAACLEADTSKRDPNQWNPGRASLQFLLQSKATLSGAFFEGAMLISLHLSRPREGPAEADWHPTPSGFQRSAGPEEELLKQELAKTKEFRLGPGPSFLDFEESSEA